MTKLIPLDNTTSGNIIDMAKMGIPLKFSYSAVNESTSPVLIQIKHTTEFYTLFMASLQSAYTATQKWRTELAHNSKFSDENGEMN